MGELKRKMDIVSWCYGCFNMAASLAFSAVAHHSKHMSDVNKISMHRAVGVHQLSALGFLIMGSMYKETPPLIPFGILFIANCFFPCLIYYQSMKNVKTLLARFVPMAGMMHMVFWVSLCFYPVPKN